MKEKWKVNVHKCQVSNEAIIRSSGIQFRRVFATRKLSHRASPTGRHGCLYTVYTG